MPNIFVARIINYDNNGTTGYAFTTPEKAITFCEEWMADAKTNAPVVWKEETRTFGALKAWSRKSGNITHNNAITITEEELDPVY